MLPRPRADVDDPVGVADRVFIVLDHYQGVSEVTQTNEGVDQSAVVSLVKADTRFIEDVQHPNKAATDLGGEPDALRLATGECAGSAVEGQVVQADIHQERKSLVDFLEYAFGDRCITLGQRHL